MNTAQVTSGHEEVFSWVWSWCRHPTQQRGPTALSQNPASSSILSCPGSFGLQDKLVQVPLRALKCFSFFFFLINTLSMAKRKFVSLSLEKTEFEWDQPHTPIAQTLSVFFLGERYQEEDPHLVLCELSKRGAQAQRQQCRQSKQCTFQIIALFVSQLSEKGKDDCLLLQDSYSLL